MQAYRFLEPAVPEVLWRVLLRYPSLWLGTCPAKWRVRRSFYL